MTRIKVAVGIVYNSSGQVLVGQRVVEDQYFRKWEFPGGKLEAGESVESALAREFDEEVGISILSSRPLMTVEHDYEDRHVKLYVRIADDYAGQVTAREGQALRWVPPSELPDMDFLQGNQVIIDALTDNVNS